MSYLEEKRTELISQQQNKKYDEELGTLRSAVERLAAEVETLKSTVSKLSEATPVPKEKQAPLKTETKEPHPRQGNFSPDDIDIQKVFYFGTK